MSGILGAPNPFDANHGFTLLARRDADLRGGSTVGAVAVGGSLGFGPYNVSPKPAAVLDEIPVGLLVGGGVVTKESSQRLTVGANGRVLVGDLDAPTTVPVGRGVAVVPAGGTVNVTPRSGAGPQDVDAVASPGTFEAAFHGVFADLAQRAARSPARAHAHTDAAGSREPAPSASPTCRPREGDGPVFWSVRRRPGPVGSITIDPAPTDAAAAGDQRRW